MKAIVIILTAIVMIATMVIPAFAENRATVKWSYDGRTNTLTIYGHGEMDDYAYAEQPWWKYRDEIKHVVILNGVTTVGKYSFYGFPELMTVSLPRTVHTLNFGAFIDCENLIYINIPTNVKRIDWNVFENCKSLYAVTIPRKVEYIGDFAFYGCSNMRGVSIPRSVKKIGNYAFDRSGVKTIYYAGTRREWSKIEFGYHSEYLINIKVVFLNSGFWGW